MEVGSISKTAAVAMNDAEFRNMLRHSGTGGQFAPLWVRLEKVGNTLTGSYAHPRDPRVGDGNDLFSKC